MADQNELPQVEEKRDLPFDVSKQIESHGELVSRLDVLSNILKDQTEDWLLRMAALEYTQKLIKENVTSRFNDFTLLVYDKLRSSLIAQLEDRRSTLCKEACRTVSTLAETLGNDFEQFAAAFTPTLIRLLVITIKVMATAANDCLVSYLPLLRLPFAISLIVDKSYDVHPVMKSKCAEFLDLILGKMGDQVKTLVENNSSESSKDNETLLLIEASIKKGLADSAPASRAAAKSAFLKYKVLAPQRAESLFATLEPAIQGRVSSTSSTASASTRPNFRAFAKKPVSNKQNDSNKENENSSTDDIIIVTKSIHRADLNDETKPATGSPAKKPEATGRSPKVSQQKPVARSPVPSPSHSSSSHNATSSTGNGSSTSSSNENSESSTSNTENRSSESDSKSKSEDESKMKSNEQQDSEVLVVDLKDSKSKDSTIEEMNLPSIINKSGLAVDEDDEGRAAHDENEVFDDEQLAKKQIESTVEIPVSTVLLALDDDNVIVESVHVVHLSPKKSPDVVVLKKKKISPAKAKIVVSSKTSGTSATSAKVAKVSVKRSAPATVLVRTTRSKAATLPVDETKKSLKTNQTSSPSSKPKVVKKGTTSEKENQKTAAVNKSTSNVTSSPSKTKKVTIEVAATSKAVAKAPIVSKEKSKTKSSKDEIDNVVNSISSSELKVALKKRTVSSQSAVVKKKVQTSKLTNVTNVSKTLTATKRTASTKALVKSSSLEAVKSTSSSTLAASKSSSAGSSVAGVRPTLSSGISKTRLTSNRTAHLTHFEKGRTPIAKRLRSKVGTTTLASQKNVKVVKTLKL